MSSVGAILNTTLSTSLFYVTQRSGNCKPAELAKPGPSYFPNGVPCVCCFAVLWVQGEGGARGGGKGKGGGWFLCAFVAAFGSTTRARRPFLVRSSVVCFLHRPQRQWALLFDARGVRPVFLLGLGWEHDASEACKSLFCKWPTSAFCDDDSAYRYYS